MIQNERLPKGQIVFYFLKSNAIFFNRLSMTQLSDKIYLGTFNFIFYKTLKDLDTQIYLAKLEKTLY